MLAPMSSRPADPVPITHTPHSPHYHFSKQQKVYIWLTAFFVACLLIGDIIGNKLFRFPLGFTIPMPWIGDITAIQHSCGMLTFPVTFLLTDLINEYYGKKGARRVTWIGLTMGVFVFIVINIALAMPHWDAPFNVPKEAFDTIFGSAKIMYVASLCAYIAGQLADIAIFGVLKRLTKGKAIWLRATGSTVISQMFDSFVVTYIAFGLGRTLFPDPSNPAPMGFAEILRTAATGYTLKFVIAIAITPLIYAGHGIMKRWFGLTPMPVE